jgi:hypothetical protein
VEELRNSCVEDADILVGVVARVLLHCSSPQCQRSNLPPSSLAVVDKLDGSTSRPYRFNSSTGNGVGFCMAGKVDVSK